MGRHSVAAWAAPAPSATSSGLWALDHALGEGGYQRGSIVELCGPPGSGKTTLALHALAACQERGGVAAFIDADHSFCARYALALGVHAEQLWLSQPVSAEQAFRTCQLLIRSGAFHTVVIDSLAALAPRDEPCALATARPRALHTHVLNQRIPRLVRLARSTSTTLCFVDQTHCRPTARGPQGVTAHTDVRLTVQPLRFAQRGSHCIGQHVAIHVVRSARLAPRCHASALVRWGSGVDPCIDLFEAALGLSLLQRTEHGFAYGSQPVGRLASDVHRALECEASLFRRLQDDVKARLSTVANRPGRDTRFSPGFF